MQKQKLIEQLRNVDELCIESGEKLSRDNVGPVRIWFAIYTLSVAMFYILSQLIKECEKHE